MKKERDIDEIFRGKLEGFPVAPPSHLWDNIKGGLAAQKRKKRMLYIGWVSAAAVILLALVAGWYFNETTMFNVTELAETEAETLQSTEKPDLMLDESNTLQIENGTINDNQPEQTTVQMQMAAKNPVIKSKVIEQVPDKTLLIASGFMNRENIELAFLEGIGFRFESIKVTPQLVVSPKKESRNFLPENEEILIAENIKRLRSEKTNENSWKLGMNISPGYSSHTASHAESYNQQITYSEKNGNSDVTGGFSIQYKTSKKWSLESGVYYAQNGQKSENSMDLFSVRKDNDYLLAPSDSEQKNFSNAININNGNLTMNSTAGVIALSETPKGTEIAADLDSRAGVSNSLISNGEFSQVFDFVEIPLYVRYQLVDSKFDIELLGGVNAGVVVGNNAYIDNEFGLQNIGKTQDISTVNLSGTLGLGVNYALGKHFSLAVEPRFSYYLNSINSNPDVNFRPYRVGFVTGVYYEF